MRQPVDDSLRLNRREDDVVGVGYDDGPGSASVSGIDKSTPITRLLNGALDRRRLWTDDRNDPVGGDHVAKPDVDKAYFHREPQATPFRVAANPVA